MLPQAASRQPPVQENGSPQHNIQRDISMENKQEEQGFGIVLRLYLDRILAVQGVQSLVTDEISGSAIATSVSIT
jgi:hypothetical protein